MMKLIVQVLLGLVRLLALLLVGPSKQKVRAQEDEVPFYDQGGRNHWHWRQWHWND